MADINILKHYTKFVDNGFRLAFNNESGKTIKYMNVTCRFYNAVDDSIYLLEHQYTGPFEDHTAKVEDVSLLGHVSVSECRAYKIEKIDLIFMDGSYKDDCTIGWNTDTAISKNWGCVIFLIILALIIIGVNIYANS